MLYQLSYAPTGETCEQAKKASIQLLFLKTEESMDKNKNSFYSCHSLVQPTGKNGVRKYPNANTDVAQVLQKYTRKCIYLTAMPVRGQNRVFLVYC
jgi:hypothetical protein